MSENDDQDGKLDSEEEAGQSGVNESGTEKGKWLHCLVPDCNKRFQSCWSLTRHTRTHTGEKPFRCASEGCGKEFIEKCALRRHEQTHNNEKQYSCYYPHCGKKFKLKEYLDVHKRTHIKDPLAGDCQPCDLLDPASTEGLSDAHVIEQLRERLLRYSIRRNEESAELKAENEQMKACLKECRFALEISLSLLQSSSSNTVPKALIDILNKITNASKYFNREDCLPFLNQEPKQSLLQNTHNSSTSSSSTSYGVSPFNMPLSDQMIHSDVGNSRLRRFEYWEAPSAPIHSNNGLALYQNEDSEANDLPSPKRIRSEHENAFVMPVSAEVPILQTDGHMAATFQGGQAMTTLAMTALSMFP